MPMIQLTPADFKSGQPLDTGWYEATIKEFDKGISSTGKSIVYKLTLAVTDPEVEGTRDVKKSISLAFPPARPVMGQLIAALNNQIFNPKEALGFDDDALKVYVGTKLWVFLSQVPNQNGGGLHNEPDGFVSGQFAKPEPPF